MLHSRIENCAAALRLRIIFGQAGWRRQFNLQLLGHALREGWGHAHGQKNRDNDRQNRSDRYPPSPRIVLLKRIRVKLRGEETLEPTPTRKRQPRQ
jgi:hypothetical protein